MIEGDFGVFIVIFYSFYLNGLFCTGCFPFLKFPLYGTFFYFFFLPKRKKFIFSDLLVLRYFLKFLFGYIWTKENYNTLNGFAWITLLQNFTFSFSLYLCTVIPHLSTPLGFTLWHFSRERNNSKIMFRKNKHFSIKSKKMPLSCLFPLLKVFYLTVFQPRGKHCWSHKLSLFYGHAS